MSQAPGPPPLVAAPSSFHPSFRPYRQPAAYLPAGCFLFRLSSPLRFCRHPLLVAAGLLPLALLACTASDASTDRATTIAESSTLFTRIAASASGIAFENRIPDTQRQNVFTYRNHYNGGGVAIGDLNGDSLPEVILTSNADGPTLYVNAGAFKFRDATKAAGLRANATADWTTGVLMADFSGDGRLDLYVSHAGMPRTEPRANELYVNLGNGPDGTPRFEDQAAARGVTDGGFAIHAAALDYDRDGDLDLFVLNNSPKPVNSFGLRNTRADRDRMGGARLYRNDGARFTDVSVAAGIYSPEIAFGLGVVVSDVNRDGWPDLYASNDFFERDYLYLNRHDGTFAESLEQAMPVSSYFSMGLDIADVNNDGWPDIYTTDMLPRDEYRLKTISSFEGWDVYQARVQNGYHHQLMRNMLQLNAGNGRFHDVGQVTGVDATDWSWSPLLVDFDLDGRKDLYVTNGLVKDVTSQDYITSMANQAAAEQFTRGRSVDWMGLVKAMTSTPVAKYAYRNAGDLRFDDVTTAWGLDEKAISSGSAYGDLDGDGAPDLVVNNSNGPAFVYRNNARTLYPARHWLRVQLVGAAANRFAIGARVTAWSDSATVTQEVSPARGYQSSVDYVLTMGLGSATRVDSLVVDWPDGRSSTVMNVSVNSTVNAKQADAARETSAPARRDALLMDVTAQVGLDWVHRENDFIDFDRDRLIPRLLSTDGPGVAVGDVNGDGLDDLYLGGAKDQPGQLRLQTPDGRFRSSNPGVFEPDSVSEDVGARFVDVDGDGDLDLYVVSGGNEYAAEASALQDRLYRNDGRGRFTKTEGALPPESVAGSRVAAADIDGDGDIDLFVGGRIVPWQYGVPPRSLLLVNDGRGRFRNNTVDLAPALDTVGMVTDAAFVDVTGDERLDLVVVGDWMPIRVFRNVGGGRFEPATVPGLDGSNGLWNRLLVTDLNGDGKPDLVVGNFGRNSRLHGTASEPATLYVKDFMNNGIVDQVLSTWQSGKQYPFAMRDDIIKVLPFLKARFNDYRSYGGKTIAEVFTPAELAGARVLRAAQFASVVALNEGEGRFRVQPLPMDAQRTPLFGLWAGDLTGGGKVDLLVAGNFLGLRPELGRIEGLDGLLLRGSGQGQFAAVSTAEGGVDLRGSVRDLLSIRTRAGVLILAVRNNEAPRFLRAARPPRR